MSEGVAGMLETAIVLKSEKYSFWCNKNMVGLPFCYSVLKRHVT